MRVLSRILTKAKPVLQDGAGLARAACRDRTRSAQRQMQRIMEAARQRGEQAGQAMPGASRRLLDIAAAVRGQAQRVGAALRAQATGGAQRMADTLDHHGPLLARVISQTTRRVLDGEAVPAAGKLASLFEPHTAIVRKGKPGRPTEFGRVLRLDEVEGGLITRYELLAAIPPKPTKCPAASLAIAGCSSTHHACSPGIAASTPWSSPRILLHWGR